MRFLCLHGNGTNSHIMEMQTAALRHELEDDHVYEFVEAVWETPMAEGLDTLTSGNSQCYAFYDPSDLPTLKDAVQQLDDYIAAEGPFDAIMAFSAGAVLSAAYLLKHATHQVAGPADPIKAAVFLSSAASVSEFEYLGFKQGEVSINIPTTHIWGSHDTIAKTGGSDIVTFCKLEKCFTFVHDGGHEMPKKEALTKAVHRIRRMLQVVDQ